GRSHHRLAATHIALQQAQHRPAGAKIRIHFLQRALLRRGELKWQRAPETRGESFAILETPARITLHRMLCELQPQVMGEELLECKTPLCRMAPGGKFLEACLTRRTMHVS